MALAISLGLFLLVGAAITLFGYHRYVLAGRVYEAMGPRARLEESRDVAVSSRFYTVVQFAERLGRKLPPSPAKASLMQRQLLAAGYRAQSGTAVFRGVKIMLAAGCIALALAEAPRLPFPGAGRLMAMLVIVLAGYRLPDILLARRVKNRKQELRTALPDALELMVVCAEAGAAIDRSFRSVTQQLEVLHPALSDEFALVTAEITAGVRRKEALEHLAARCDEPEMRKFVEVLMQAERFGTSMGDALRTHASYLRVRRRQQAEERAGKVGVKLIFPIFFFIMPCMFLVTVGPAAMQIGKHLLPMLGGRI